VSARPAGGTLEALTALAERAGLLLAQTGRSNAIDATVVASAAQRGDIVVTSDKDDLAEVAAHATNVRVEAI
jgi:predicted nuclease of predicted toxin-antitoxin system